MNYDFSEENKFNKNYKDNIEKKCKKCGSKAIIFTNRGSLIIRCSWKSCKFSTSVWKGTIFYKSKLKPCVFLALCKLWLQFMARRHIALLLKISKKSVSKNLKKL
ncbi:hypothetical protein H311_05168, partial [Anncaliia algerae PRA109]